MKIRSPLTAMKKEPGSSRLDRIVSRIIKVCLSCFLRHDFPDTGTGRRSQRGRQGTMHTEDRVPGESKAFEGVRRYRQDTGQVLNVSSKNADDIASHGQFPTRRPIEI